MRAGDRVEVRELDRQESLFKGRGTIIAVRTQRSEVGYLVLLDGAEGEGGPIYFGPDRLISVSEESSSHITAGG